ncbi:MAG: beta-L-arabinofuranosidase domain-containing protein [Dysgonomonas sp.]
MLTRIIFILTTLLSSYITSSTAGNPQNIKPNHPLIWKSFPLSEVQLTDSYFKQAMDRHKEYVLSLEVDRLIPHVRRSVGLEAKGKNYGGWETHGGCSYGHYMSSCALYYAATGDKQFLDRLDYILSELSECQNKANDGWFITGQNVKDGLQQLINGELSLNRPDETKQPWNYNQNFNSWYCIHKILAGLKDAYVYAEREEAKKILIKLSDYIADVALQSNSDLFQAMLSVEQGGMNEVMTDIYAITGNKKYLKAAEKFNHINVIYPIANGEDILFGRHANDQIPKFMGVARMYEFSDNELYKVAPQNFWNIVINDHTLAIGGNSCYERFGVAGQESKRLDYTSAETCNTYNMLKLSKQLFMLTGDSKYLDYYEHALYNHILASQDPEHLGSVTYYTTLLPGSFKQYSTPYDSFWCCVGTGMENHAKYGESIYFIKGKQLLVNLYIPSVLQSKENGIKLTMRTNFPESDTIHIKIDDIGNTISSISFRYPSWLKEKAVLFINNKKVNYSIESGFLKLTEKAKTGDEITLIFPRSLHIDYTKDEPHFGTILYGPLVMAGELGHDGMPDDIVSGSLDLREAIPTKDIPMIVGNLNNLSSWITEDKGRPLHFDIRNGEKQPTVSLIPYFQMHHQRNTVYWKIYSNEKFRERQKALTDEVIIGDFDNENKHDLQGVNDTVRWHDYFWAKNTQYRIAENGGWFSYDLKTDSKNKKPYFLISRYWGDQSPEHEFDIYIDSNLLTTVNLNRRLYLTYIDDIFEIPFEWTKGKSKISVKFQAKENKKAGVLFSLKITSDKELR